MMHVLHPVLGSLVVRERGWYVKDLSWSLMKRHFTSSWKIRLLVANSTSRSRSLNKVLQFN